MTTIRLDAEAIRERQRILKGQFDCAPQDRQAPTNFGKGYYTVKGCPFWQACSERPRNVAALCELSDEQSGIDTMTENPFGGWSFELTVKAKKVIDDPLDFGEDEQHE